MQGRQSWRSAPSALCHPCIVLLVLLVVLPGLGLWLLGPLCCSGPTLQAGLGPYDLHSRSLMAWESSDEH